MDCDKVRPLLDGYLDGELGRDDVSAVDGHVQGCGACRRRLDAGRAIAAGIRKHAAYRTAPRSLRARVRTEIAERASPSPEDRRPQRFSLFDWKRWLPMTGAIATAVMATAVLTFAVTVQMAGVSQDQRLIDQLLSGHSRAVLTSHQIDVVSSDQHTVKPWLSSRLDFSPAVTDLSTAGFPLRGGRVDYVNERPVAVLVYGHRQHVIDLFIWPDDASSTRAAMRTFSKRGLNVVQWSADGMTYWAVSDLATNELKDFAQSYSSAS